MIEPKNFRRPKGAAKHRWIGIVIALVLGAFAAISLLALEPPDPLPASAQASEFSAERAFSHVQQIAKRPHPVGSAANAEVRNYLVGQLEDLGLQPTIQEATSARTMEGTASIARVHNIHARIPGSSPTGHVVLVAHYDSVPRGPGAADDGAGVAAILEIARAITSGSLPRNDIDIVFTDAEEPWLLGAQAFVSADRLDPQRSVVLNLEARGTSGAALMFESSPDNATLIPALANAQRPIAGSEWEACSQLLPGDTDFTVFRDAGFGGMNFAFFDGSARYHTPEDSPANLDPASLQHMGATVLATAHHFADQDLGVPRGESLTYFTVLGELVHYPQQLAAPLAVLAAVVFVATLLYGQRRGVRIRAVGLSAASFLGLLVVTTALGMGAWQLLLLLHPGYGSLITGDTYRPEWYAAGLLLLTAALSVAWYLMLRRRRAPEELILATWAWFLVLAILSAAFVPGAAYLFSWTPLVGSLLLAAAIRWGGQEPAWRYLASSAAALPAVVLLVPLLDSFFSLGLAFVSGPMFMAVLVLVTALPVLDLLALRRPWLVPVVAALVVGLGLFAAGLRIDTFDEEHPRQTRLVYALDADRQQAWWLSADPDPPPWTDRYVGTERIEDDRFPDSPSLSLASSYYSGPASVARIEPPDVTVRRSERNDETRELRLRITPAEASRIALYADTRSHTVTAATVDGINVEEAPGQREDTDPAKWGFVFHGVPPEGIDVTLEVRGEGPLPLRVIGYRDDLPQVPELTPRPDELTWSGTSSNLTMIAKSYRV
jgi:prepilin-type processing-associated H-X9-DG protein